MLELEFTTADLARTRFAISPLWETIAAVRALQESHAHPLHRPWWEAVRPRLDAAGLDWGPLRDLVPVPTSTLPSFICPPPTCPLPELEVELTQLRATPAERVRDQLASHPVRATPWLTALHDEPGHQLPVLAELLRKFWDLALAPYWPRIRALLEGEVRHRAQLLAEGGVQRLFTDLDPQMHWGTSTLHVAQRNVRGPHQLHGRGLLLVPSVFVWPKVFSRTGEDEQTTLRYPPRGIGTLWERPTSSPPQALAGVLGRSRAVLLHELANPATTSELAARVDLSAGAVSQHLGHLRAAGLIASHRAGRLLLHARTHTAQALLASAGAGSEDPAASTQDVNSRHTYAS